MYLSLVLSHLECFIHECVVSSCKLLHFSGIEKNQHWLITKLLVMHALIKLVIFTIRIILKISFGQDNLRSLFPGLAKSGMYSYFCKLNSRSKLGELFSCMSVWADRVCLQKNCNYLTSMKKVIEYSFTACSKTLSAHYPKGSLLFQAFFKALGRKI